MSIIKDIVQETDIERTRAELMTVKEQLIKLNRQYAWWPTLLHGIINGFGTAIGAGLLVALAAFIFGHLTGLPIFGGIFDWLAMHLPRAK